MLFQIRLTLTVDAMDDDDHVEIIALGALQAAKAHVHSQLATVEDSNAHVARVED
jgi:hypothetical protein